MTTTGTTAATAMGAAMKAAAVKNTTTGTVELIVEGLTCGTCEPEVRQALESVPGVRGTSMGDADGLVIVDCGGAEVRPSELLAALEAAGYTAYVTTAEDRQAAASESDGERSCGCCAPRAKA